MAAKILIVDDKKLLRDALIDYLDTDEYVFMEAESGERALELFRQQKPDLVILDQMLPGIDGLRTLQLMKKISPDTKVIGLTGELSVDIRHKYFSAGAYDVQAKSAIYEKLIPSIKSALEDGPAHGHDYQEISYEEIAQELKNDDRWEESALFLKEAGIEQQLMGNAKKAKTYFAESVTRYNRAGRSSKAREVEQLLEDIEG